MNIVLCGMMGAGKTTVGIKIAEKANRRWYDTDGMITERHGRISDIFEYYGEPFFRNLESTIVKELAEKDELVISTGGGLVLLPENAERLKQRGKIVFLRAKSETLLMRLKIFENRPLLQANSGIMSEKLNQLMKERTPVYERVADYVVDVDGKNVDEVAEEILSFFKIQ